MRVALLAAAAIGLGLLAAISWGEAPSKAPPASLDGRTLFAAKGCGTCHLGPDPASRSVQAGPSLANLRARAGIRRPGLSAEAFVRQSILEPAVFISPNAGGGPSWAMPKLAVDAGEVDALVRYLLG